MKNNSLDSLLKPSLSGVPAGGKMYSLQSHFLVAFFGGPIALVLFAMWSVRGISRLKYHVGLFAGLLLLALVITVSLTLLATQGYSLFGDPTVTARTLLRLCALCLFGVVYLALRHYFNLAGFDQSPDPSPWVPGIVAILLGIGMQIVLTVILVVSFDLEAL